MVNSESTYRAVFSVMSATNIIGNTSIILVILKSRVMKTPIHYLLLNLAVADLTVGVFVAPVFVFNNTFDHPAGVAGDVLCKLLSAGTFAWTGALCSVLSLVLIAVERYYAITQPTSLQHRLTSKKLKVFIPGCWAVALVFNSPYLFTYYYNPSFGRCLLAWPLPWLGRLYSLLWFVIAGVVPGGIMAVLYSRVIRQLWFGHNTDSTVTQAVKRSRKKITKTMLTVTAIYALCWYPELVMWILANFHPKQFPYRGPTHLAGMCLMVVNSSLNPLVYALQFKQFRRELVKIVFCGRQPRFHRVAAAGSQETQDSSSPQLF